MVKKFLLGLALWVYHLFEPLLFLLGIIVVLTLVGAAAGLVRDNFFGGNERREAQLKEQAQQEAADLEIHTARQEEWPMLLQRGLEELARNRGLSEIPKDSVEYRGFEAGFYETMAMRSEPQLFDHCVESFAEAKKPTIGSIRQMRQSEAQRALERLKRRVPYGVPADTNAQIVTEEMMSSRLEGYRHSRELRGLGPDAGSEAMGLGVAFARSLTQPEVPGTADEPPPPDR
jgi:hypothetical protein